MAAAEHAESKQSFLEDIQLSKKTRRKLLELKNRDVMFHSIQPCSAPTSSVVILNGGLANGVTREFFVRLFGPVSPLSLLMTHRSEYAIVDLPTVSQATEVKAQCDGREIKEIAESAQDAGGSLPQTTLSGPPLRLHVVYIKGVANLCFAPLCKQATPPGLVLQADFISEDEEKMLLRRFCAAHLPSQMCASCQQEGVEEEVAGKEDGEEETQGSLRHSTPDSVYGGRLKLRRVEHYGYEFRYGANNVDPASPLPTSIPEECQPMLERMLEQGLVSSLPNQLTVNEYQPGQGETGGGGGVQYLSASTGQPPLWVQWLLVGCITGEVTHLCSAEQVFL